MFEALSSDAFAAWAETAERPIVPRDWEAATGVMLDQVEQMKVLVPQLSS